MRNALILHGTDMDKDYKQHLNNWFPWLKGELEKLGYEVWLPELPEAWHPDMDRYWNFLKDFDYNEETILVGHSSGGSTVFGILNKLLESKKVKMAISVAGFYQDKGWGCEGLFRELYNFEKIKKQAEKIYVIWSPDDPYITKDQTDYFCKNLNIEPIIYEGKKHFSLEGSPQFNKFPELLEIIKNN